MQEKSKLFWRVWGIVLAVSILVLICSLGYFARLGFHYYQTFLTAAGLTHSDAKELFSAVINEDYLALKNKDDYLFLVLGLDSLADRNAEDVMTDTILLAHLDLAANTVNLLSLPRDIYLPELELKINALYNRALTQGAVNPQQAVADYLSSLIGEPIDITLLVSLEQTQELVDLLGGVEVDVERSFVDSRYPRSGIDVSIERDPAILYETIFFEQGPQVMDGATLLKYMRSRYADGEEGSDIARNARQQKAISAFVNAAAAQVFDQRTLLNFVLLGRFYNFYLRNYEQYLPSHFALALGLKVLANHQLPVINQHQLSIQTDDSVGVLLEATPREMARDYHDMWVWKITDPDLFVLEIRTNLGYAQKGHL
ncbi:LCP family protein [Microgenomates group bacterium]|nr:LCP family protein [Microgenomates group bacterium]